MMSPAAAASKSISETQVQVVERRRVSAPAGARHAQRAAIRFSIVENT